MDYQYREEQIIEAFKTAKEQRVKLEERRNVLLEEMQRDFNVKTKDELDALIDQTKNKIERLESKIEPLLDKLERGLGL